MAAGMGSRYGGVKQIESVGPSGEAIMDYSVFDALRAGFGKIVFVIRRQIEDDVRAFLAGRFGGAEIRFAYQETEGLPPGFSPPPGRLKPWGTAHAVLAACGEVDAPFAVINADDFYGRDAFRVSGAWLASADAGAADFAMAGYRLRNTLSENGAVSRGVCRVDAEGRLVSITEHTKIERNPAAAPETPSEPAIISRGHGPLTGNETVSMNMFCFTPRLFPLLEREFRAFLAERGGDPGAECYLPAVVSGLIASGEARVAVLPTTAAWFGVTYREDKPAVQAGIRALIRAGEYPQRLWAG
jgi:hypothetical protein